MTDKQTIEHILDLVEQVKRAEYKNISAQSLINLNVIKMNLRELLPEDDLDAVEMCSTCSGSGIGQSGDPDSSRCPICNGSGVEPRGN